MGVIGFSGVRSWPRRGSAILAVAMAAAVVTGLGMAGTAQAAAGAAAGNGSRTSPAGATKCFPSWSDCSSTDPSVAVRIYSVGDTSSCAFKYTIDWGDVSSQMRSFPGGADGTILWTFRHAYAKGEFKTYKITLTGTLTSGSCGVGSGMFHFTLTANAGVAAVRFAPEADRDLGTPGLPVIKDDGSSATEDGEWGPATCNGIADPRSFDYLDCRSPVPGGTPDKSWPVIYVAGSSLSIDRVVFVADGPEPSPELTATATVSGPGPPSGSLTLPATTLTSSKVGGKYQLTATGLTFFGYLPAVPGRDTVSIAWTITQTGTGAIIDAGTSRHTVYVTAAAYATPFGAGSGQVRYPYETLVDVGTVAAGGQSTQRSVFDAIWKKFETRDVGHPILDPKTGTVTYGKTLKYYNNDFPHIADWFNKSFGSCPPFAKMLADNSGHCGNWAQFLAGVLAFQGIPATAVDLESAPGFKAGPPPGAGLKATDYAYMLVGADLWHFRRPDRSHDYPYSDRLIVQHDGKVTIFGRDVTYDSTKPIAQGPVSYPPMMFQSGDHAIVDVSLSSAGSSRYVDPSYGNPHSTTPYASIPAYEETAIAGFAVIYEREHGKLTALPYSADIAKECKDSTCYFDAQKYPYS